MKILKTHFKSRVNHFFIALLTGLVFLSSCGDDDDGPSADLPLEGTTWIETNFNTTNCDDPSDNTDDSSNCDNSECFTIVFTSGTVTVVNFENGFTETSTGTFTVSGNTITTDVLGGSVEVGFTISGATLTISFEDPFDGCFTTIVYRGEE